jgi:O-antigen/teichoic acid export membrane protein
MKDKLVGNIFYSFLEKLFQILSGFIASFFIIRMIDRESYGVIGIVAGFYALVSIFNFSYESIIVRDHKNIEKSELGHFMAFSVLKMLVLFLLSSLLSIYLYFQYNAFDFVYAVGSIFLVFAIDFLSAPIVLYLTSKFRHDLISKVSFVRYLANVLILLGLFIYPSLKYIFIKDILVFVIVSFSWFIVVKNVLKIKTDFFSHFFNFDRTKFLKNVNDYSLWTHLVSCVTFFIYRADTIFLSMFTPLKIIGNYSVALSCGNFANIAPSILGFQSGVAISNVESKSDIERISSSFSRVSIISSIAMAIGLFVLGEFLLRVITGQQDVEEIFFYTKCIVTGLLLVKSLASPMVSVIQMKGSVKDLFFKVNLPVLILTALTYYFSARFYGPRGVAISNIINSTVWIILVWREFLSLGYRLELMNGYREDFSKIKEVIRSKFC